MAAWDSSMGASTSNRSIVTSASASLSWNSVESPAPALLTSMVIGCSRARIRAATTSTPSRVARSTVRVSTEIPYWASSPWALPTRAIGSLPVITRSWPWPASWRANSAPSPEVAPVMRTVWPVSRGEGMAGTSQSCRTSRSSSCSATFTAL